MSHHEYTERDLTKLSIAERACLRPGLNTVNGTLEEVYSYLAGCNLMVDAFKLDVISPTPAHALGWIYREFNSLGSGFQFDELRRKYGSDEKVLSAWLDGIRS